MDHRLRHRSATTDHDNAWELDEDGCVLASIGVGYARPIVVAIRVRKAGYTALPGYALTRLDSTTWRVASGVYDEHWPESRLPRLTLLLTDAPEDVSTRLARLID